MRRAHTVKLYIDANLHHRLTGAEVAVIAGLARTYFFTSLKRHFGIKFRNYINLRRVEQAKVLLETTYLRIPAVARQVGFTYHSAFTRAFREASGGWPLAYRQRHRRLSRASSTLG